MDNLLIFLHIPKCGGVTFHRILEKNFGSDEIFSIDGKNPWQSIEDFLNQDIHALSQVRLIKGHLIYGIHKSMPQHEAKYITFIRDPIKRLDSLYRYVKSHPIHPLHDISRQNNFNEFALHPSVPDNLQTKVIAGVSRDRLLEPCSEAIYFMALNNLQKDFLFVGTLEKFEEALLVLHAQNILKNIFFVKRNITRIPTVSQSRKSADRYHEIYEHNKWDYMLYERVSTQFSSDIVYLKKQGQFSIYKTVYFRLFNNLLYSKFPKSLCPTLEKVLNVFL